MPCICVPLLTLTIRWFEAHRTLQLSERLQLSREAGIRDHLELIDEIDRIPIGFDVPK